MGRNFSKKPETTEKRSKKAISGQNFSKTEKKIRRIEKILKYRFVETFEAPTSAIADFCLGCPRSKSSKAKNPRTSRILANSVSIAPSRIEVSNNNRTQGSILRFILVARRDVSRVCLEHHHMSTQPQKVLMVGQFRDIASEENKIHHQMLSLMNILYSIVSVREKFGLHKNPFLTVCKQHLPELELASYSSEEQNQKIKDYFAPNFQMDVTQRKKFTLKFVRMLTFFLERFNLKRKELVKVLKQVSLENMNDKLFGSSGKYSQAESSSNLKLLETGSKRRYVSCSVDDGVWAVGETAIKRYDPVGRLGVSGDSVFVQVCNGEKWTNEQIFSPTFIDVCIKNQVEHVYEACNEKIA